MVVPFRGEQSNNLVGLSLPSHPELSLPSCSLSAEFISDQAQDLSCLPPAGVPTQSCWLWRENKRTICFVLFVPKPRIRMRLLWMPVQMMTTKWKAYVYQCSEHHIALMSPPLTQNHKVHQYIWKSTVDTIQTVDTDRSFYRSEFVHFFQIPLTYVWDVLMVTHS